MVKASDDNDNDKYMDKVIDHLYDVHGGNNELNKEWCEGFVCGLSSEGIINEDTFDKLIEYIREHK